MIVLLSTHLIRIKLTLCFTIYFTRRLRRKASLVAAAVSNLANLAVSSPTHSKKLQKSPPSDSQAKSFTPTKREKSGSEHQDAVIAPVETVETVKRKRKKQRALTNTAVGNGSETDEIAEIRRELEAKN